MTQESRFWARVLELAQKQIKKNTYDYFVSGAQLIKVENFQATILLDSPVKQLFWDQNLADVIITAGFEIFNNQITVQYIFQEESNEVTQSTNTNQSEVKISLPPIETGLKAKYTFDNFVQGDGNVWALSAALAVSENLATTYNPLFIYGGPGLGKTHLLNAIGNQILENIPDARVKYIPAETFINDFLEHLRLGEMESFKRTYRSLDLLLIDDIQFLADKDKTQEVFHNLFNDFHMKKKQVIISSDRPPKELLHIEPRLKSRFALGLVADVQAPDFETRIAILESKLQSKGISIDFEYLSLIAQYIKSNVRELEGALNILITRQQLSKAEISEEDVYSCLKTLGYYCDENQINFEQVMQQNKKSSKNFSTLVEMVAQYYSLSIAELKSDSRKKEITQARQILMLLAKKYFNRTLEKIGDYFGGKNHATAIYAINTIEKKLKSDSAFA